MQKDLRLKFKIDADTKELVVTQKNIDKVARSINTADNKAKGWTQSMVGITKLSFSLYSVKQAFDAMIYSFQSLTNTASTFENFESTLGTIEGSSKKAKESMTWIENFSKQTPYQIDQVTESFVKMRAYGIDPTDGTLKSLGDTASAMNKPLMQAVEAMADAMVGENERLKEFGVRASVQGKEVAYNWTDSSGKAKHIIIQNNSEVIKSTLTAIFNSKYKDQMQKQMGTYKGMVSNMQDSWMSFKKDIMDAGLFAWIKAFIKTINDKFQQAFLNVDGVASKFTANMLDKFNTIIDGVGFVQRMFYGFKIVFNVITLGFNAVVGTILTGAGKISHVLNKMIGTYNFIANKFGMETIDFKFNTFESELKNIRTSMKEDIDDISNAWGDAVANPHKIADFKAALMSNFKSIHFETQGLLNPGSAKTDVVGAKDGVSSSSTEEEKTLEKKQQILKKFEDSFIKSQLTQTGYAFHQLSQQYQDYAKYVTDKNQLNEWLQAENKKILDSMSRDETTWKNGALNALKDYYKKATDSYSQINSTFTNALSTMEDSLVSFVKTGKLEFSSFRDSIINDMIKIAVQRSIMAPISSGLMGMFGFQNGGMVPVKGYATGGLLQGGSGVRDDLYLGYASGHHVVAMGGEYILNKQATNSLGVDALNYMNSTGRVPGNGGINLMVNVENKGGGEIEAETINAIARANSNGGQDIDINIVIDKIGRNVSGSRDALKGMLQ